MHRSQERSWGRPLLSSGCRSEMLAAPTGFFASAQRLLSRNINTQKTHFRNLPVARAGSAPPKHTELLHRASHFSNNAGICHSMVSISGEKTTHWFATTWIQTEIYLPQLLLLPCWLTVVERNVNRKKQRDLGSDGQYATFLNKQLVLFSTTANWHHFNLNENTPAFLIC